MSAEARAAIALGGNVGDVAQAFADALAALDATPGVRVIARSNVWRTPPWGKTDQPDFLNMAALVETTLAPHALLDACLALEQRAGRVRAERWGPRVLDIDVLLYDGVAVRDARLTLPHPRMAERAFVLLPLAEIAPDWMLDGESVAARAARIDGAGLRVDAAATAGIGGAADPR